MLNLCFSYLNQYTVSFDGFMDEDNIFHPPKDISLFYPWVWITDMKIIWKKKLKELVQDWHYGNKPDQFYVDFDWKFK